MKVSGPIDDKTAAVCRREYGREVPLGYSLPHDVEPGEALCRCFLWPDADGTSQRCECGGTGKNNGFPGEYQCDRCGEVWAS